MKKTSAFILVFALLVSCKKETGIQPVSEDGVIEGLELTYTNVGIDNSFKAIFFVNENVGYIAGADGLVCETKDGGKSWLKLPKATALPLYDIYFLDEGEGFAVGGESFCGGTGCEPAGPVIIRTNDGGKTWTKATLPVSDKVELKSICFATPSIGFAVGGNTIFSTKDKGKNWSETKINNIGGAMLDVEFINDKSGMISCVGGKIIKTQDGGLNWSVSNPFPAIGGYSLSLVNENSAFSAGYTSISKSTDFGNSWTVLHTYPDDIFKLVFKTSELGYAFGRGQYSGGDFGHNYGAIFYTVDGGLTWRGNDHLTGIGLIESASFPSEHVGYAVNNQTILKIVKK